MERLTISCECCERLWTVAARLSFYEQQSLESRPCPHCGAYTLACHDPDAEAAAANRATRWQSFYTY